MGRDEVDALAALRLGVARRTSAQGASSFLARATTLSTVKPYFAQQHLGRRRGAEAVDAEHVAALADVAMPALRHAELDGEPRRRPSAAAPRRDSSAAAPRTGPSSASRRSARATPSRRRRSAAPTIRPTSEPLAIRISVGLAVRRIAEHVGAAAQAFGAGVAAAVERRHVLPRQHQQHRPVARLERDLPGDRGLVGVGRADDGELRESRAGWPAARPAGASGRPRRARCCRA